jgi:BASS family bile acid:Na+ symporter
MTATQWLMVVLQGRIMLTVFGLGLSATFQDATYLFRRPGLLARAFLSMNIVMPVIAVLIAANFALPIEVKVALAALAVSPVPPILGKKQLSAGGRMDYVVGLLVAMSLLAIVVVPLAIAISNHLFEREAALAPRAVAKTMLTSVLLPLLAGLIVGKLIPVTRKASGVIVTVAGILLAVAVLPLLIKLWPVVLPLLRNGTLLVMIGMAIVGLAVGHVLGGPRAADRTALALSTTSRHPAVALAVATSGTAVDTQPALALILLYVVVAAVVCIPYMKWRARADAPAQAK